MKAKVLATGEIREVFQKSISHVYDVETYEYYRPDEIEILPDASEKVIEGWLTKEKDNDMKDIIMLHEDEPRLEWQPLSDTYSYESMGKVYWLPDILFPDLTYENSPKRVKITITPME